MEIATSASWGRRIDLLERARARDLLVVCLTIRRASYSVARSGWNHSVGQSNQPDLKTLPIEQYKENQAMEREVIKTQPCRLQ